MNEQIQLARRYVRMVWPHRWSALALSLAICILGWSYVFYLPNIYEVRAKIFVDTQSMLRPLLRGLAIDTNALVNTANLMRRTLMTRPNLEEVARKADLDLEAKTEREFDMLVDSLGKRVKLTGTSTDNIYEIAFEDADIQRAKRIVDELLNRFLETALGSTRRDTAVTQKFLDEQIQEYERRLIEAEERLKEFKQRNAGKMPGTGNTYFEDLELARARLKQADLEMREAINRGDVLRRSLAGEEPVFGLMGDQMLDPTATSKYDGRIEKLEEQLDQLKLHYTEKHPDVVGILEQIERLKEKREEELTLLAQNPEPSFSSGPSDPLQGSVYQEMNLAMAQADAEVAALRARVEAYQRDVEALENAVGTMPEIEAELKRLDRDYGLNKQQYEELLKRREAARLSEEADAQADDIKLKVIEPPRIPLAPIGPKRVQLLTMVMLAALGAGAGLAVLLSQINPRFYSSEELKEVAQLPLLGTVSLVFSRRQQTERRMELAMFAVVLLGLFSLYGALVALDSMHVDLNAKLVNLVGKVV
ncbi:MAG: Wzz/FepE/Etk N-terminal domain-containing protein [Gammaproteobacteria bacterium]